MKKALNIASIVMVLLVSIGLIGIVGNDRKTEKNYDEEAVVVADWAVIYNDADSLFQNADLAVEGIVQETEPFLHWVNGEAIPYTIYKIKVINPLKGTAEIGDIVSVAQFGGIVTAEQTGLSDKYSNITPAEKQKRIFKSFGAPLSQTGDKVVIYASSDQGHQILSYEEPYYMLLGDFMGKLTLEQGSGKYVREVPDSSEAEIKTFSLDENQIKESFNR